MQPPDRIFMEAKAAVQRMAWSIRLLRARLRMEEETMSVRQRLAVRNALYDLENRHFLLSELQLGMAGCAPDELAGRWREFFACYDDFIEASRCGRLERVSSNDGHTGSGTGAAL
jgi:hypothetical protein